MTVRPHATGARRTTALLASVALMATTATALTAQTSTAADAPTPGPRADLAFTSVTKPGVAGQYQLAESDDTGDLFLTSASGRPPVLTATLARVNPETLAVEATAELPVIKHEGKDADGNVVNQFKQLSTHGVYVDDTHDNVWVTNTRDEQVSVYDRDTLEYVGGTYDPAGPAKQQAIAHPREVVIDEERNLAYVTAANRGAEAPSSVTVYSTVLKADGTLTKVKDIVIAPRADYPVAGESAYAVTMGLEIDEATGLVYTNDFRTDEYYVIDPKAGFAVTRHAIPNPTVGTDGLGALQPSSIAVDPGAGELYTVNQTQGTSTTSLNVFDLRTHTQKYSVETGPRALGVDVDRQRGLVYVADFENGTVSVVDARNGGEVIEVVKPEGVTSKANHILVAGGSAYMVDKFGANKDVTVDYSVDLATGNRVSVTTAVDSITRITPAAEATVAGTATVGGDLTLQGEGWLTADGRAGSTVAVKIDKGAVRAPDGTDVWATIQVGENGTFESRITLPEGSITPGAHTLNLLTGSLKAGDVRRSVAVEVTVAPKPAPTASPTPTATPKPTVTPAPVVKPIKVKKKPVVKGTKVVGKKLRSTRATFNTSKVKVKYQWLRNGKAIKGATASTYTLRKADARKKIRVKVVGTKSGWKKVTVTSKAVTIKKKAAKKR